MDVLSKKYSYIKIPKFCKTMFYFTLLFAFKLKLYKKNKNMMNNARSSMIIITEER